MERKRGDGVLWEVAELFDLPGGDGGDPAPTWSCWGISSSTWSGTGASSPTVRRFWISTPRRGVLRLRGTGLRILSMTAEALRIGGGIDAVEWVR